MSTEDKQRRVFKAWLRDSKFIPSGRDAAGSFDSAWDAWQAAIASQAALIAELKQDAERWKWMRDKAYDSDDITFAFSDGKQSFFLTGKIADDYIDRARFASSSAERPCAEKP